MRKCGNFGIFLHWHSDSFTVKNTPDLVKISDFPCLVVSPDLI